MNSINTLQLSIEDNADNNNLQIINYNTKTIKELIEICKLKNIIGYSNKTKSSLITLLQQDIIQLPLQEQLQLQTLTINTNENANENANENTNENANANANANTNENANENINANKLRMIDLFAGTGAFTYAFEKTGRVKCVFANDMNEWSQRIYNDNFTDNDMHKLTLQDLNNINIEDIPPHDILTGGFPCQPFSIAGAQQGFNDVRSNVFWKILEIIDYHKPKCVILENVKNLISHDNGNTFTIIKTHLETRGYFIKYKILNTSEITGIPQNRERIYIVCIKSQMVYDKFNLDFEKKIKVNINTILESTDTIHNKYYYNNTSSTWHLLNTNVIKQNTIYQYRRVYVRENKSNECPTLTANMGTGGHNVPIILDSKGIRKLTPLECFKFQGFPNTYKLPDIADAHLYKLAGNAVSVPVVELIAQRLIPLLIENINL